MPFPKIDGNEPKSLVSGWCTSIWVGSGHKYEAGKFIELLASKDTDWMMVELAGQTPIWGSTLKDHPDFFETDENRFLSLGKWMLDNQLIPTPNTPTQGYKVFLYEAMHDYYLNGVGAMEALKIAEDKFNSTNGLG